MAVNKVVYGTTVLVDLTEDTVTAGTLAQGYTAHDKSGALITGTALMGSNDFIVTLSYNESTQMWEPDKTFAEIKAAHEAGKTIAFEADQMAVWWSAEGQNVATAFYYAVGEETSEGNWFVLSYGINSTGVFFDYDYTYYPAPSLQSKTATPTESQQSITPDSGYDGLSSVTVEAISSTYVGSGITRRSSSDLTASGATVTVPAGYYSAQASKAIGAGSVTAPTITVDSETGEISASTRINAAGYLALNTTRSSTRQLDTQAATTITPSTSAQTAVEAGKYTTGAVTVAAMPSGTAGTPTATKGTVSNHSVSVTPSVTNTAGYIAGGTKNGTAVTVSASELVSGSQTITANGTVNVTNLASVTVDIDFVTYHTSSSEPTSSQGSDNDIWLVTE